MSVLADAGADLARFTSDERRRHPVPGTSLGVISNGTTFTASYGVTSVDHPLAVTPDTLFQIGSITKTFLATLIMHLVDQRTLDLDEPVRRWLPSLRLRDETVAATVTLRHLLTHSAGWFGDHFGNFGSNDDALARYVESMAAIDQQVPIGTVWAYNNAAFSLAGRVVEVVTDLPIERAMHDLLFVPLGLRHTFFFAHEVVTERVAVGHNVFDGVAHVARPWALPRDNNCRGGIVSTVNDVLLYASFHLGDGTTCSGGEFLSRQSLALMSSPLVGAALGQHRGIAWSVEGIQGVRIVGHTGATIGQQALLWIAPAMRSALAVLSNSNEATRLHDAISRWWLEHYVGVTRESLREIALSAAKVQGLIGTYRNPSNELRIAYEHDALVLYERPLDTPIRLWMHNPPPVPGPVPLSFTREDRLVLRAGPLKERQIEILSQRWVRFGGRIYERTDV